MSDEEKVLKMLEIMQRAGANLYTSEQIYWNYKELLKRIEEDRTETIIDKIKMVYKRYEEAEKGYCDYDGIKMLKEIRSIIHNNE